MSDSALEATGNAAPNGRRFVLTPLTYYFAFFTFQNLLAPIGFLLVAPELLDIESTRLTFALSFFYLSMVVVGWNLSGSFGARFVPRLLTTLTHDYCYRTFSPAFLRLYSRLFLAGFVVAFFLLAFVGTGKLLWLTNSREAYQFHRTGVGPFYASSLICLYLSFIFGLFALRETNPEHFPWRPVVLKALLYMALAYLLGSKGYILGLLITTLLFYNYNWKPIRAATLIITAGLLLVLFSTLQLVQGTAEDIEGTILYANYFRNTSEFLRRFDEFGGFRWGQVFLSNVWDYVPRGLYPDKPYDYGAKQINAVLFPGAAERSFTPGQLTWAADYLDVGPPGVLLSGLSAGLMFGWAHRYYLARRPNAIAFTVLLQLGGMIGVFAFVPTPVLLLVVYPLFTLALRIIRDLLTPIRTSIPAPQTG